MTTNLEYQLGKLVRLMIKGTINQYLGWSSGTKCTKQYLVVWL